MLISLIISSIYSIGTPLALSRVGKLTHYRHIIPMILLSVPADSQQILTEGPILLHQFVWCLVQGVNQTVVNQKALDFYQQGNVGNGQKRKR